MDGIKEKIIELLDKLRKSRTRLDEGQRQIDASRERIRAARSNLQDKPLDIVELDKARRSIEQMEKELTELENNRAKLSKIAGPLVSTLEKIPGLSGVGILPLVPAGLIAAVGALIAAVAVFWSKVVNGTRRINLQVDALDKLTAGEISQGEYETLLKATGDTDSGGGFFGDIKKFIWIGLALALWPSVQKLIRVQNAR